MPKARKPKAKPQQLLVEGKNDAFGYASQIAMLSGHYVKNTKYLKPFQ